MKLRAVLIAEIPLTLGIAIWIAGTSAPPWVRMFLVSIMSCSALIILFHLLASCKKDD